MTTLEFTADADADRIVHLNIPVEEPGKRYHVIVHLQPAEPSGGPKELRYLTEEFIRETAGKWVGDFDIEPEGDFDQREPL